VLLPLAISAALWDKHGPALALAALVVVGWIVLPSTFSHRATLAWSRQHVVLDGLLIAPLLFLVLAMLTSLSLGVCAAVAAVIAVTFLPVAVRRGVGAHP
jgi:ribose/xylose/arabinose/galactoside ABC-type transport system permease subunit